MVSGSAAPPTPPAERGNGAAEVDIIVVSYNQRQRLLDCCRSALAGNLPVQLIVVDNASTDGSAGAVRHSYPAALTLPMSSNLGFAAAVNRGVRAGRAPQILLLNNDAVLHPEALPRLAEALEEERVAAAGPRLIGVGGQVELSLGRTLGPFNEAAFRLLEWLYREGTGPLAGCVNRYYRQPHRTRSLSAACMLLKRAAVEEIGGFDERFFLYAEDVDLCRRLRQRGWCLRYVPAALVEHRRGASAATERQRVARVYRQSQLAFYRKHHGALAAHLLRFYLVLRFACRSLLSRGEGRRLAITMLRWTLRDAGKPGHLSE
ncbi:MAG: glycosyltransferase family 2 protein [Acidobacteriota bacterium]